MNHRSYQWILYVIVAVIVGTIAIQIYWNYKNYLVNKQQLINDVHLCLDNALEGYYAGLAQNETIAIAFETASTDSISHEKVDSLLHKFDLSEISFHEHDTTRLDTGNGMTYIRIVDNDTLIREHRQLSNPFEHSSIRRPNRQIQFDSLTQLNLRTLTSRVVVSLTDDDLKLETIDSLLKEQLEQKQIDIVYGLIHKRSDFNPQYINKSMVESAKLNSKSTSPYLAFNNSIAIFYNNPIASILKRIFAGILLSSLLVFAVVACLFYLLKIIKHQKLLAEVKNDLISNITHEFKTPIATIGVALESIKNFNVIKDTEKTQTYLNMSSSQLEKLNTMVEKLLETATLDSNHLQLNKDPIDVGELLENLVQKHSIQLEEKCIAFTKPEIEVIASVDVFHFENAINNIIDNAIKYGGNEIDISLEHKNNTVEITITDSGSSLTKTQRERIFEKFYRIPKGNTHDVKGFGIGLYYTKKIIENHGGCIGLEPKSKTTTFIISLPQ